MPRSPLLALTTALLLTATPAAATGDPLPTGGTLLVGAAAPSVFTPLPTPVTTSSSSARTVSADGRYVAFRSDDDGLVADDDDGMTSVYRKDRQTGAIVLVSRATTGGPNHSQCSDPSISGDGNRVAFSCSGPLDPADDNGSWDVYVRDVAAGTTTLVSRTAAAVGDSASMDAEISGNGNFVAFESSATNLVAGAPGGGHIYRRSLADGTVAWVDRPNNVAAVVNGIAFGPTISDDGDRIAFTTLATNLTSTLDTNGVNDVYVRTVSLSTTAPVSTVNGDNTAMANHGGSSPAISGDGAYVVYTTISTNDVGAADSDSGLDVRRRTLGSTAVQLISRATGLGGAKGSGGSDAPQVDTTGQWIAFQSSSPNLDPAADPSTQVYLRHVTASPTTQLVSPGGAPGATSSWPAISADASTVVFSSVGHTPDSDPRQQAVFARDLATATTSLVSRPPGAEPFANTGAAADLAPAGALSADGRYAVFSSSAPGLPGSPATITEVWRRDNLTGDVVLVSRAGGPAGAPADSGADNATISADGQRVAFISDATNLDPAVTTPTYEVYVRDIAAGTTTLASRLDGPSGAPLSGTSMPFLAAGGTRVAFSGGDPALGGNVTRTHVVIRDLAAQHTIVVGADQDADATVARLDAAGTRVAWATESAGADSALRAGRAAAAFRTAAKIGKGGSIARHVWWADVAGGTPQQLDAGAADDPGSRDPSLSEDGTRAAFATGAALLGADTQPDTDVYVRDLTSGALQLASIGLGGTTPNGYSSDPVISGDGGSVAFLSSAGNLTADPPGTTSEVFVRDLAAGTTTLASRGDGADGARLDAYAQEAAISRDGGCVLFSTSATALGTSLSPEIERVWLRAVHGTCPATTAATPGDPPPGGTPGGGTPGDGTPGGGTTGGGPEDASRPAITRFRAHPARFPRRGRKAGTRLTLRVDRAATVRVVIERVTHGHREGRRCRPGPGHGARRSRCTIARRVTTLRATAQRAGTVTIRFTAKVHGRPIPRGTYRATATAKNAGGTSKPRRVTLRAR